MTTGKWPTAQLSMLTSRIMVGIASAATHAYADTGVPMLRNQNIKPGHIDDRDVLYINSDFERLHRNKRLRAGDVIVVFSD